MGTQRRQSSLWWGNLPASPTGSMAHLKLLPTLLLLLLIATAASAATQVLIDTDFGVPGKAFSDVSAERGNSITGALPEGWGENSGWKSKVVATYEPVTEAGRSFLRVTQTSGDGLQFRYSLPGIEKEAGYYRLTLTARSVIGGSLGLRFNDAPYSTAWTANPAMDAQWRDFSYDFRLTPQKQDLGLYFYLSGNGTLDLQKLKLIKLSEQDLIEEIKAKYPDAGSGNLMRLSRFPLGLQSGWAIDRDYSDGDQVQVDSDPKVPGPSGVPSLRLTAPDGLRVYSAPFATPWSFDQHTVSLYVRGDWDGKLLVGGGRNEIRAQLPLKTSGDQWQRVELTFKPLLLAPAHHLRLEGKGTLWIDQLQVEHAAKATAYAPQTPVEVSLALPASEASSARVLFEGAPLKMNYAVVGLSSAAVLKARLVTLYGDEKLLPPVKLAASNCATGTLNLEAFKAHPLGAYRLEAWVEDATGKKLSAENELVIYRLRRPRYWGKDAPNSFFGIHTLSANRHLTMAKAAGCNWVRLHDAGTEYIGWAHLEPEKGKWQFRDADLKRYRDHNLKILGLLSTAPGWATNWGKPTSGYFDRYMEPLSMDDWANAVRTIVSHHKDLIDTYEIWNEPWGSAFWSWKFDEKNGTDYTAKFVPSETPSADYARLQKVAYSAAHDAFPKVNVVGFNTYGAANGTKWTSDLLGFGALDTCDTISYHHYESSLTGFPGDATEKAYRAAVGPIIDKLGRVSKPVWMSEGCPESGDVSNGFYRYTLPYENTNDNWRLADRLVRYVVSRRANGESKAFLYTMHGISTFGGHVQWTTLVTAEGYLHPSAAAHSAMAWLLEDTDYVKRVPLAEDVYAYLFSCPARSVAVISTAAKHAPYKLPKSSDVQRLDLFGNPLPPGAPLDDHLSYVVCSAGLTKLQSALGK
jgi:hypothetical protein